MKVNVVFFLTVQSKKIVLAFLMTLLIAILSGCGLISSKPVVEVAEAEVKSKAFETLDALDITVSSDVVGIDRRAPSIQGALDYFQRNVALRLLSIENESLSIAISDNEINGYYWLDGTVKRIYKTTDADNSSSTTIEMLEVESSYDAELYIVTAVAGVLNGVVEGQYIYLDGFYDTFSGFFATQRRDSKQLLEQAIDQSSISPNFNQDYKFSKVSTLNKRRQSISLASNLASNKDLAITNSTRFFDAYSKQVMTKNSFWRAVSADDSVFAIVDEQMAARSIWLIDEQARQRAVVGVIKSIDKDEVVLSSEMWLLDDAKKAQAQVAEISLKLIKKSQIISQGDNGNTSESSRQTALVPGQLVVVEGFQKNRLLEVGRVYIKDSKKLPVYAYGVVKGHKQNNKAIDLSVEWMFGAKPSNTLEIMLNDFTEFFEIDDDQQLSSEQFWRLLSLSDDIEVEGQMLGNTLQANRLFLGNKQIELQTLSGTVSAVEDEQISLRLYSYIDDVASFSNPESYLAKSQESFTSGKDVIDVTLAKDAVVQEVHLAESLVVQEFWRRLEPSDQLTVKGYFENNNFVATSVEFEDNDTTPFVFGEVEAFDAPKNQIMLKGKNQVVVLTRTTAIKDVKLARLSAKNFWSELSTGDSIDVEGRYKDGIFFATEVFLSSEVQTPQILPEAPDKKDTFNLFDWLMN